MRTYDDNLRGDVKTLLLDPEKHLILKSNNLIQDVHNLATGVRVTQDLVLSEVTMRRQDDNVKHHWNSSKEFLQGIGSRGLKEIQEKMDVVKGALGTVSPTLLQSETLESEKDNNKIL